MCVCVMMCEFGGCIHVYRTKKKKNLYSHIRQREHAGIHNILCQVECKHTCVNSIFVKISIFCSNNLARWLSRSWLLARCVFDRLNLSSRRGLLREELVLPVLSECRCFRIIPRGKICLTSVLMPSNCKGSKGQHYLS